MKPGKNPFLILILNFIVGIAVGHGLVPAEHQDYYVELVSEIVGNAIILATSIVSLYQVWKIGHPTVIVPPAGPPLPVENPQPEKPLEDENTPDTFRG